MWVGDDSLSIHASDAEDAHLISKAEGGGGGGGWGVKTHPNLWLPSLLRSARILPSPVEEKAPALPPDMAECFNSSFPGTCLDWYMPS